MVRKVLSECVAVETRINRISNQFHSWAGVKFRPKTKTLRNRQWLVWLELSLPFSHVVLIRVS